MSPKQEYRYRVGGHELFVAAPHDEFHKGVFQSIAPGTKYDSVLEEWRFVLDGQEGEKLFARILDAIGITKDTSHPSNLSDVDRYVYGYAQTALDEAAEIQVDALREAGIPNERIYFDKLYGRYPERPKLLECRKLLRAGDILLVHHIEQLGRSLSQLVETMQAIESKNAFVRTLSEPIIDTGTEKFEKFVEHIAFASKFEKSANSRRTKSGLEEAKRQGRRGGGRPNSLTEEKIVKIARDIVEGVEITKVAKSAGVSRATIYRSIPGGLDALIEAHSQEGQRGINRIVEQMKLKCLNGVTEKKKQEILRLYKADTPILAIAEYMSLNRETVRRVIEAAYR